MDGMMDRIRDEMAKNAGNSMIQVIGDHLTAYLQLRPGTTLKEGATIEGAIKRMSAARKTAKGNMGALDFLEGMKIVYEEFGLEWSKQACMQAQMSAYDCMVAEMPVQTKTETQAPADEFDLDAFLGGD